MTKRLIEIDDRLLERAHEVAGTSTIEATIELALRQMVSRGTKRRHVARLRQ